MFLLPKKKACIFYFYFLISLVKHTGIYLENLALFSFPYFMLEMHIIPKHTCVCLFYTNRPALTIKCVKAMDPPASVIAEGF